MAIVMHFFHKFPLDFSPPHHDPSDENVPNIKAGNWTPFLLIFSHFGCFTHGCQLWYLIQLGESNEYLLVMEVVGKME